MRRNDYLGASGQKSDPYIRSHYLDLWRVNFHYRMTAYISCFCAEFVFDLVTLTFDLLTSAISDELSFTRTMHTIINFSILQLSVPGYVWPNLTTLGYLHLKRSLRMRHVTWPMTRGKMIHIFEILESNLFIHFVTFRALQRRLNRLIGENSVFPLWRLQSLLRSAVSGDLCTGGPPKPHVTIFEPELSIHYTTFMGLRWRLRVVLYRRACPC